MQVSIDPSSGFCWGVVRTVEKAEETLNNNDDKEVYILGQIIHILKRQTDWNRKA